MSKHDDEKRSGEKLKNKDYVKELRKLQTKLCKLQDWIVQEGLRVVIVLEGRDAAGKGGTIKAITERVSPRIFRVVALPAPSDREKSQLYIQRVLAALPRSRRSRHLRPQLVQPRRRRICHGFLLQGAVQGLCGKLPQIRKSHYSVGHHTYQILARSRPSGARKAVCGAGSRTRCGNGNSAQWIWNRLLIGMNTPVLAT